MTAPTEEAPSPGPAASTTPPSAADRAFIEFLDLDAPRPSRTPRRSRWWRFGFPALLRLLFTAGPGLGGRSPPPPLLAPSSPAIRVLISPGTRRLLQRNLGRLIAANTDP